ncbi:MAG: DNA primase [Firmicutes bacterium]|nr:DNA primase [Bacillota bacterium]
MIYPQEVIEEVRANNDIVDIVSKYVALTNKGGNYFGLCPFHNEKTPSFSVNSAKQMYHCFGCGAGGNVVSFVMQSENYNFLDAIKFLADRIHYTLPTPTASDSAKSNENLRLRSSLQEIYVAAARFYHDNLQEPATQYLLDRGITPKIIKNFGLGFSSADWDKLYKHLQAKKFSHEDMLASDLIREKNGKYYDRFRNRIMFPIIDFDNKVVGFGGRIIEEPPNDQQIAKYLNSAETPLFSKKRQLYGINTARKAQNKDIIIVEGYMDVIALHQAGFTQAVGVLGTALTVHHCRLLKRANCNSVILLFDRDSAGVKAMYRSIPILLNEGIKVRCLQVTEDVKDPDEYIKKYGVVGFLRLLDQAKNHATFRIDILAKERDLTDSEQRIDFTQQAARVLAEIQNPIEADVYIQDTAELAGISADVILSEVKKDKSYSAEKPPRELTHATSAKANLLKKGFANAVTTCINILLVYPKYSGKIKEILAPENLDDNVTLKILDIVHRNNEHNLKTEPADIITQFETLTDQKHAAEILKEFATFEKMSTSKREQDIEKLLNDMCGIIKKNALEIRKNETQQITTDLHSIGTVLTKKLYK